MLTDTDSRIAGIPLISLGVGSLGVLLLAQSLRLFLKLRRARKEAQRDRESWSRVPAKMLYSRVEKRTDNQADGHVYVTYSARFRYEYRVAGTAYEGTRYSLAGDWSSSDRETHEKELRGFPEGGEVTVWVNPQNPAESVLRLDEESFPDTTLLQFLLIFFGIGLVGLAVVIAVVKMQSR